MRSILTPKCCASGDERKGFVMARIKKKLLGIGSAPGEIGLNVIVDRNGHQLIRGEDQTFVGAKTFSVPPRVENAQFLTNDTAITKRMLLEYTRCISEVFEEVLTVTDQDLANGYIKLSKNIAPGQADSLEIVYYEGAAALTVGLDFGYVTDGDKPVNKLKWDGYTLGQPGRVVVGQEIHVRYNTCRPGPESHYTGRIVWLERAMPPGEWNDVCWSSGRGLFCAVLGGGRKVATSPDGETWTEHEIPFRMNNPHVCWSQDLGLFCAVDGYYAYTSPDGVNWAMHDMHGGEWHAICWSSGLGLFCAVGNGMSATSPDGEHWTMHGMPDTAPRVAVCWSPELQKFCAIGFSDKGAATSPDGENWTLHDMPFYVFTSVCWSPERRLFCSVGYGFNKAVTSPDGEHWTEYPMPDGKWNAVCWGHELGLFCAVAEDSGKAATSPDGETWTEYTIPTGKRHSICWAPALRRFCLDGCIGVPVDL